MERIQRAVWWIIVVSFAIFALLTASGIGYIWFVNPAAKLPYMGVLFSNLVVQTIGLAILLAKRTLQFTPSVKRYKNEAEVNEFLRKFALRGSSVEIVSNRAAWLATDDTLKKALIKKSEKGGNVTILTARKPTWADEMKDTGVNLIYGLPEEYAPNARFTLLNSTRQGAEELAIAVGSFPGHDVFIFDHRTSPHIIGLAKDIVKLLRMIGEQTNEY